MQHHPRTIPPVSPLSPAVAAVRDVIASVLGVTYCSCLINFYPDGESGMRWHADPLGDGLWADDTAVGARAPAVPRF